MNDKWRAFVVGVVRVFLFAFLGVFTAGYAGVLTAPDVSSARAAAWALGSAAVAAGIKAVVDAVTTGKTPFPAFGILSRKTAP